MRTNFVAGVVVCFAAVGVALSGDDAAERKKLEGSWKAVSGQQGGKKLSKEQLKPLEFKGDKVVLGTVGECEFTLDPDKKPKEIEVKGGFNLKGEFDPKAKGVMKGIYDLKDDTLTLCLPPPNRPRPTKFESPKGDDTLVFVLKRDKK
jgi:uncharacterized protein (TIGR03067 family)